MRPLLLTLLLTLAGCADASPRDYALRIISHGNGRGMACSATAVGPNAIETAAHCLQYPLVTINGRPAKVVRSEGISEDRIRVVVSVKFRSWAPLGRPVVGERVRWWGQPGGMSFVYREGHVSLVAPNGVMVDGTVCYGDSGSGLFNDAGELVGVVSAMTSETGCTFVIGR